MGLHASSSVATTLAHLRAAGITIVRAEGGWFIKHIEQLTGPYTTPEVALEESMRWLAARAPERGWKYPTP